MARQNQNGSERRRVASVLIVVGVALLLFSGWVKMRNTVVAIRTEKAAKQDIVSLISTNGKIEPVSNFEAHAPAPATVKRVLVHEGDHVKAGQLLLELDNADALAQKAKAYAQLRSAEADLLAVKGGGTNEEVLTTRADLSKATAEQQEAQRNLQAVQKLAQNGAASPAELQAAEDRVKKADADVQLLQSKLSGRYSTPEIGRAEANVTQARAAYAATQELLNNAIVHSPFDGTVYQLPVKQGSYV